MKDSSVRSFLFRCSCGKGTVIVGDTDRFKMREIWNQKRQKPGQIKTTSAKVTLNCGLVRESPQYPHNSGLGNILICPEYTLLETNIATEIWWLEDAFSFWDGLFSELYTKYKVFFGG